MNGTMLGLAWGQAMNDADYERERQRLQDELRAAAVKELSEQAQKDAIRRVANAVMKEVQDEAAGKPVERRLSDPANAAARTEDFIDTADHLLRRISGGALAFSDPSVEAAKTTHRDVKEHVLEGGLPPKPVHAAQTKGPKA